MEGDISRAKLEEWQTAGKPRAKQRINNAVEKEVGYKPEKMKSKPYEQFATEWLKKWEEEHSDILDEEVHVSWNQYDEEGTTETVKWVLWPAVLHGGIGTGGTYGSVITEARKACKSDYEKYMQKFERKY